MQLYIGLILKNDVRKNIKLYKKNLVKIKLTKKVKQVNIN